jgi:GT2 family glycosyltransferase
MSSSAVTIVVPTVDGGERLDACLASVEKGCGSTRVEIMVADGSGSGEAKPVVKVHASVNLLGGSGRFHFASNCNRAARAADSPLVLFLNDDVVVEPGFLAPLLTTVAEPTVFAVTPRILRIDRSTGVEFDESRHRTFFGFGLFYHERIDERSVGGSAAACGATPIPVPFGCGAALLVRRDRFLELGGFDTLYEPFYWEDFDLCYRAWKRGWKTMRDPRGTVHHVHRATIASHYTAEQIETIHERNRWLCTWKNVTDWPLRAMTAACVPAKLAEARWQRRHAFIGGYRLARELRGEAARRNAVERAASVRTDRAVLTQA